MKYMERGGFQTQELMRWTLTATCLLLAGFWITNFFLFVSRLGWTPGSVVTYYRGSEAEFRAPRTAGAMLEVTHSHLAMMALVMLLLTHLLLFASYSRRAKLWMIGIAFGSALFDEGSGWLVRFVDPRFAWLKLLSFWALQGILGFLLVGLVLFLSSGREETQKAMGRRRARWAGGGSRPGGRGSAGGSGDRAGPSSGGP
jgi:uncharacterized membrane protein YgcG